MEFDFSPYDRMAAGLRILPQKPARTEREALAEVEHAAVWPFPTAWTREPCAPCTCRACIERRAVGALAP